MNDKQKNNLNTILFYFFMYVLLILVTHAVIVHYFNIYPK